MTARAALLVHMRCTEMCPAPPTLPLLFSLGNQGDRRDCGEKVMEEVGKKKVAHLDPPVCE